MQFRDLPSIYTNQHLKAIGCRFESHRFHQLHWIPTMDNDIDKEILRFIESGGSVKKLPMRAAKGAKDGKMLTAGKPTKRKPKEES